MSFSPDLQTLKKKLKIHYFYGTIKKWMLGVNTSKYCWYPDLNIDPDLILLYLLYLHYSLWNETTDTEHAEWNKSKYCNPPLNSTFVYNFTCEKTESNPDTNFLSCLPLAHSSCMSPKSTSKWCMVVTEYKTSRKGDALNFRKKKNILSVRIKLFRYLLEGHGQIY